MVWDDRDSAFGNLKDYKLLYFLQDDTIAIKVRISVKELIIHMFFVLRCQEAILIKLALKSK